MSAYALPGLFPPIESLTVGRNADSHTCTGFDNSVNVNERKKEQTELSLTSTDCNVEHSNIPLHHDDQNRTYADKFNNNDKINYMSSTSSSPFPSSSNSNIGCLFLNSAAIAVKEAKIDPARWIQYVTGGHIHINNTCTQHYAHQIGKNLRRRISSSSSNSNSSGGGSSQASYVGINNNNRRKLSIQTRGDQSTNATGFKSNNNSSNNNNNINSISANNSSNKNKNDSPQNQAIEFELSITFNGRKYTAKRTMQCIMQLRDDLIREMKHRRQWLTQERGPSSSSSSSTVSSHVHRYGGDCRTNTCFDPTVPFSSKNNSSSNTSTTTTTKKDEGKRNDRYIVQIPEIPPLTSDDEDRRHMVGDTGFVGRGFTMLHAMVTSYVPVMEGWLKNVMDIVPQDSECLMNFLWEPTNADLPIACFKSVLDSINNSNTNSNSNHHLHNNTINSYTFVSKKFKSCTSLATLGSIKEMEHNTDEEDSDNDEENGSHYSQNKRDELKTG